MEQVNKLDPALGQAHLFNDEQNAVRRKEYFVLVTTTRTSELNTVDSWNKEIYVVGSVNTIMSQSIPTGYIPPGQPPGISSKNLPGGSGFDF